MGGGLGHGSVRLLMFFWGGVELCSMSCSGPGRRQGALPFRLLADWVAGVPLWHFSLAARQWHTVRCQ